jgi:hypothetical protein
MRPGLTEQNFRLFEPIIAKACAMPFEIDPRTMNMAARTFMSRFSDARKGYRMNRWHSKLIPVTEDISFIRARETANGMVWIDNKIIEKRMFRMQNIKEQLPQTSDIGELVKVNWKDKEEVAKWLAKGSTWIDSNNLQVYCRDLVELAEATKSIREQYPKSSEVKSKLMVLVSA